MRMMLRHWFFDDGVIHLHFPFDSYTQAPSLAQPKLSTIHHAQQTESSQEAKAFSTILRQRVDVSSDLLLFLWK